MCETIYNNVTHCIFDMDGLLIDSERVYKMVYGAIVQNYGHEYGGTLLYQVLGRPEKDGQELIISHYNLPLSIEQFSEMYFQKCRRLQIESFQDVDMPGAEKLLRHLKKHNIPIALATSSSEESYNLKTKHLTEVFDLFDHKVLGGSDPDVKIGKPNPDIFLVAAKRFLGCPDPSKCLVFEDAPNGVQAGVSAGMQTVMVPDPNLPKEFTKKATLVLNSLEDFKPEQFGLPKFD